MFFFPSSEVLIVIKIVTLQRETPLISIFGPDHIERGKYKKKKKRKHIMILQAGLSGQKNSKEHSYALNKIQHFLC